LGGSDRGAADLDVMVAKAPITDRRPFAKARITVRRPFAIADQVPIPKVVERHASRSADGDASLRRAGQPGHRLAPCHLAPGGRHARGESPIAELVCMS